MDEYQRTINPRPQITYSRGQNDRTREVNVGSDGQTNLGWRPRNLCQDCLSYAKLIETSAVSGKNTLEPKPTNLNQTQATVLRKRTRTTSSVALISFRSRIPSYSMDHGRRTRTLAMESDIQYPAMKAKDPKSSLLFHPQWEDIAKPPQASWTSRPGRMPGLWSWSKETLSLWKNTVTGFQPLDEFSKTSAEHKH